MRQNHLNSFFSEKIFNNLFFLSIKIFIFLYIIAMLPMWLFSFSAYIFQPQTETRVALVFGAGVFCKQSSFSFKDESAEEFQKNLPNSLVNYDCSPSSVLEQRLNAAIDLWKNDKVDKIIVSGDNRSADYNEPFGMFRYLKDAGVPTSIIVQDFAGFSTADTCYRAKHVFLANSVYVITQPFHIPRATALCQSFGLQVRPVPAFNTQYFQTSLYGFLREIPASWSALFKLYDYNQALDGDGTEKPVVS